MLRWQAEDPPILELVLRWQAEDLPILELVLRWQAEDLPILEVVRRQADAQRNRARMLAAARLVFPAINFDTQPSSGTVLRDECARGPLRNGGGAWSTATLTA